MTAERPVPSEEVERMLERISAIDLAAEAVVDFFKDNVDLGVAELYDQEDYVKVLAPAKDVKGDTVPWVSVGTSKLEGLEGAFLTFASGRMKLTPNLLGRGMGVTIGSGLSPANGLPSVYFYDATEGPFELNSMYGKWVTSFMARLSEFSSERLTNPS